MQETTIRNALAVIEAMADGTPAALACEAIGISWSSFWRAKRRYPELQTAYDSARAAIAHRIINEILGIADSEPDANRARVRVDARKWAAEKYAPDDFGPRVDVTVKGEVSLTAALDAARARLRPIVDLGNVQDAEVIDVQGAIEHKPTDTISALPAPGDAPAPDTIDIFEP